MKKKYSLFVILFIIIILIIFVIIYFANYKNAEEIQKLLSQSEKISNMYVEHYFDDGDYTSNNIKSYKVDIYIKDNIYIYNVLGRIDYANFNTNECYSIENNEIYTFDIDTINKFNDYSGYFNTDIYTYSYNFPYYINNIWCDKITFKDVSSNFKTVLYINKENGLVVKKEAISSERKSFETFNYEFDVVTDEQIKSFGI